jgi:hypothetical protein
VVPGVILTEALAQTAGIAGGGISKVKAAFLTFSHPGHEIPSCRRPGNRLIFAPKD